MTRDIKKFAKELEQRRKQFAIDIIRLSFTLPNTPEGRTIRSQLTKAGTSVAANYREANRPGVKRISGTRFLFVRLRPVKHSTG